MRGDGFFWWLMLTLCLASRGLALATGKEGTMNKVIVNGQWCGRVIGEHDGQKIVVLDCPVSAERRVAYVPNDELEDRN